MIKDQFDRLIDYLRVSVTDRCNLNCLYCSASGNNGQQRRGPPLSLDELFLLTECFVESGLKKVRITGGEPLVRKGLTEFIQKLSQLETLSDLSLTTNGILLEQYAASLKGAGIKRVNVSLDSLNHEKFRRITGGGNLNNVLSGIEKALDVGLFPVRINTVVMGGINDEELSDFVALCLERPIDVRFIELMPMGGNLRFYSSAFLKIKEVKTALSKRFDLTEIEETSSKGPAKYYRIAHGPGRVGFISPVSHSFCHDCNRARLTAEGYLWPCLALDHKVSFKDLLLEKDKEKIKKRVLEAIWSKPAGHEWKIKNFSQCSMLQMGG